MKVLWVLLFLFSCSKFTIQEQDHVLPDTQQEEADQNGVKPIFAGSPKYCVVGDVGTGKSAQKMVARALEKEGCAKILMPGDLVYSNGLSSVKDKEFYPKFYNPYKKLIEDQRVEFVLVAGNHDWTWPGSPRTWKSLAKKHPWITYPHYYYAQSWGDVCFFGFDTQKYLGNQRAWFERVKGGFGECNFSVAMGHNPYYSPGGHGNAQGKVRTFLEKTVIGKFDLYLAGHDHHMSDEGLEKGTRLLISGAGGKLRPLKRKSRVWGQSSYGYLVLQVEDNVGSYAFKRVTNNTIETLHQDLILAQGLRL